MFIFMLTTLSLAYGAEGLHFSVTTVTVCTTVTDITTLTVWTTVTVMTTVI